MIGMNGRVDALNDIRSMQGTLDRLVAWANEWEMDFNVIKCGVVHVGMGNLEFQR